MATRNASTIISAADTLMTNSIHSKTP